MYAKLINVRSVRGYANYALYDTDNRATSNRVAWTHTLNLATDNPHTAWRIIEATDMEADRLKLAAGKKLTGNKVDAAFRHLVLSWHPEQKASLDKDTMIAAAAGALRALGAQKCQTLIVAHNDSDHPHIHILYSRISPQNGLALTTYNEHKKLSRWAQAYEKQHGKIYFEQRELNNAARDRGEFPERRRPIPRLVIEADKTARQAANDNPTQREALKQKLTAQVRALGAEGHRLKRKHRREWEEMQARHKDRRAAIEEKTRKAQAATRQTIVERYRNAWRQLRALEATETEQFNAREKTRVGRLSNLLRSLTIGHSAIDGPRPSIATQIWRGLTSAEERKSRLEQTQQRRQQSLIAHQRTAIRAAVLPIAAEKRLDRVNAARDYKTDRESLAFTQKGETAKLKARWHQLALDRDKAYAELAASLARQQSFNEKANPARSPEHLFKPRQAPTPVPEQNNTRDRDQERD